MSIALRGTATTGTTTITAPTGVQVGDVLVVVAVAPSGTTITVPSGWTTQRNVTTSNTSTLRLVVAYLVYASGSSWTLTGATYNVCAAYSGCSTSTPILADGAPSAGGAVTTITSPTVNNTASGAWRIAGWGVAETTFNSVSAWSTFSPADTDRGGSNSTSYAVALTDSSATIATGNTSITGTVPVTFDSNAASLAWMGILNPLAATAVTASDTGSGADAANLGVTTADTGSGVDTAAVAAQTPIADTGAGTDTGQPAAQIPAGDTGSGADAQAPTIHALDTGSGADTAAVSAQTPATDTGSGTDIAVTGMQETDTGTDSADVAVIAAGAADTGGGADTGTSVAEVTATDTGSGADSAVADIAKPTSDTGTGADTAAVAVDVPVADTGSGADATSGTAVGLPDTGSGADTAVGELSGILVPPDLLVYVVPPAYRVPA